VGRRLAAASALTAAAATAKRAGRVEDEAALRDALLLTRPGDDVGPAGRMLLAWRKLASRPTEILSDDATLCEVGADLASVIDEEAAGRLGWAAVPLLGAYAAPAAGSGRSSPTGQQQAQEGSRQRIFASYARAALQAVDLSAELGRRADLLLAVAPKLRAKGSDAVVEKLLADDAVVASQDVPGISDRGLRRLFDRLVDLGVVRELSGRASFRIYGL